jgi:DsbC/DsbD-like thiol-disulfide interchange protein/cytochrome c biogenesis protein CcdA
MLRRFLILLALLAWPALAQAQHIRPELVAEGPAVPGAEVELAILMHTSPGWHGYWQNPGDAGLPMSVEWQLPKGFSAGPLRYPVPTRLTVAGLMNYVYEDDYALLVRLKVPPGVAGQAPIRAKARWLACTDKVCVPEQGEFSLNLPTGGLATMDTRFDAWRRALPQPLATPARYVFEGGQIRLAIPLPPTVRIRDPYIFPITENVVDYEGKQRFTRNGDWIVVQMPTKAPAEKSFEGVFATGDGRGFQFRSVGLLVPQPGDPLEPVGRSALFWAMLGAIAGGILLNLMPCVFPILALKAMHLSRAGGEASHARWDALAYTAGTVIGTGALGALLLAIRAAGTEAGWAFQLQDPRTIIVLLLLAVAITANLLGLFELPVLGGSARPAGSFGTGALAAFVATPCAGPFLGAALGTALLLPPAGSVAVFAALGFGLALPFVLISFVPALRRWLPKPGPWMRRLQRFLAIPMAATVLAALWLLFRQGGLQALFIGLAGVAAILMLLVGYRYAQRTGRHGGAAVVAGALLVALALSRAVPTPSTAMHNNDGVEAWSETRVDSYTRQGQPVFVYFTADWCLTCKVNEAGAIDRGEVAKAFKAAGVKVLVADWTNGDPAITRFLESRGRAGVPLYLWYAPGKEAEELPQVLTPSMLISRARQSQAQRG